MLFTSHRLIGRSRETFLLAAFSWRIAYGKVRTPVLGQQASFCSLHNGFCPFEREQSGPPFAAKSRNHKLALLRQQLTAYYRSARAVRPEVAGRLNQTFYQTVFTGSRRLSFTAPFSLMRSENRDAKQLTVAMNLRYSLSRVHAP